MPVEESSQDCGKHATQQRRINQRACSRRFRQSADSFSQNHRFLAVFTQWVCSLASTPPKVAASPPPNGGNGIIRGVTRRRHAGSQFLMLQNPHHCRCSERRRDLMGWPRRPWAAGGRQLETRTVPRQRNTPPPRTAPGHFRYKTRPTRTAPGHCRYKTRPARPFSPHARDKTRPARPKWPNLARFSHAWRTLYRCRQQETTHGELCTACEAETGLAITAHQNHRRRRCGGRRRDRRARAGFEIDHSEPLGSRVAISRAAGASGAWNTSGATSNGGDLAGSQPQQAAPRAAAAQ